MVGLLGPNCPEWAEWAWGTWLAGAALVPLPAPLRVRDIAAFLPRWLPWPRDRLFVIVGEDRYLDLLDAGIPRLDWATRPAGPRPEAAEVSPSDLAMVLCTSGSTAAPKACG